MVSPGGRRRVSLIGFGAIGRFVLRHLTEGAGEPAVRVAGVLVRAERRAVVAAQVPPEVRVVASAEDLVAQSPNLVVECAGHEAVREYGAAILAGGTDMLIVSTGAFADQGLREELIVAARTSGARLIVPAGAIAGVDALAAAKVGGIERVTYTSRKPPLAWRGTPAEEVCDLDRVRQETVLFEGNAGEAALLYPQNANVAATVALAGLGFEATRVRLIADPTVESNIHRVVAEGAFGSFEVEVRGRPLPDNPKSSSLTAFSVLRAVENLSACLII